MTSSVSISSQMAEALFDTACAMHLEGSRKKLIRAPGVVEGMVTTSFDQQTLGSVAGTEFFAEVESELGKGKVKFLVRDADVQLRNKLTWTSFSTIEDVMREINLPSPPSRQMPMSN